MSKSKYCTIYLVRHGETEWNVKKLMQGHYNSKLTKKGIKQAHQLKTLPSGSISNLGYVKLESDGVDFFVKQTEGIKIQN